MGFDELRGQVSLLYFCVTAHEADILRVEETCLKLRSIGAPLDTSEPGSPVLQPTEEGQITYALTRTAGGKLLVAAANKHLKDRGEARRCAELMSAARVATEKMKDAAAGGTDSRERPSLAVEAFRGLVKDATAALGQAEEMKAQLDGASKAGLAQVTQMYVDFFTELIGSSFQGALRAGLLRCASATSQLDVQAESVPNLHIKEVLLCEPFLNIIHT